MDAAKLYTSESGEVFSKQPLSMASERSKSKQKRRERVTKPKSSGQKTRKQANSATAIMMGIKHKEELMQAKHKENSGKNVMSCISRNRITLKLSSQKVGIYNKCKASDIVSRNRKTLSDVSIKLSNQAEEATQRDMRRVLGHSSPECCKLASKQTTQSSPDKTATRSPTRQGETSGFDMECSPHRSPNPPCIYDIACRLAEGLQPTKVFQGTNYLSSTKAELRKVMKQSDPEGFSQLMQCLSDEATMPGSPTHTTTTTTDQSFALHPPASPTADPLTSLALLFGSDSDTLSPSAIPIQQSVDLVEMNPQQHMIAMAAAPTQPQPVIMVTEPHQYIIMATGPASSLYQGSDLWTSEGVRTSAASMDFLDILDTHPPALSTDQDLPKRPSPPGRWLPTPDRPRMFPRKLY